MSNLAQRKQADFITIQHAFIANIRDPQNQPLPPGVDKRHMKVYQDLIFKNISNILADAFPVLYSLFEKRQWDALIQDYFHHHQATTPFFHKISEEFLKYLQNERQAENDLPFLLELAHYEWTELALDLSEEEIPMVEVTHKDLLSSQLILSPLAWVLQYQFPVHKIGKDYMPDKPGESPTYLIVYRDCQDAVGFMEINPVTAKMLEFVKTQPDLTTQQILKKIAEELQHPNPEVVIQGGLQTIANLQKHDIILGWK